MTDTAQRLSGGAITDDVLLINGAVHRTANRNSSFVSDLLGSLPALGFAWAPQPLGADEHGRDRFTLLPGDAAHDHARLTDGHYQQAARILRALHDATAGHRLADGEQCVTHGDCGPWNWIICDADVRGLIDWDTAAPGRRLSDLGYFAWTWAMTGHAHTTADDELRRLKLIRDSYDPHVTGQQLIDAMLYSQHDAIMWSHARLTEPALTAAQKDHAEDSMQWSRRCRDQMLTLQQRILAELS